MTPQELATLAPYFDATEKYTDGRRVDWSVVNYPTMQILWRLRAKMGQPVYLIRGPHPNRPEAVDATVPALPLGIVAMEVLRVPCAAGVYSGNSVHLDTRPVNHPELPARWLAIKPDEEPLLRYEGLDELIAERKPDWCYLKWTDPRGPHALKFVCQLAEAKRQFGSSLFTV
jgi:hypothetical protein